MSMITTFSLSCLTCTFLPGEEVGKLGLRRVCSSEGRLLGALLSAEDTRGLLRRAGGQGSLGRVVAEGASLP